MPLPAGVDPSGRGYPVTLIFDPFIEVESSSLRLFKVTEDEDREEVQGYAFSPGNEIPDAEGGLYSYAYEKNFNICHFIASEPLAKDHWFEAWCSWRIGGRDHERLWTFRTGRDRASSQMPDPR